MPAIPRVLTIAPSAPFLPTLAQGILDGRVIQGFAPREQPELLAGATIYLPTRRAARALAQAFLDAAGTSAMLLPRIVPLGDVDEEAFAFENAEALTLPPAISASERRLALAKLVAQFAEARPDLLPGSPAAAISLADELAHLIDDFITAGLDFGALKDAVQGELDRYWEASRDFLQIVFNGWNGHLAERGLMDAAKRRDALLALEANRQAAGEAPVVAAGSTGTLPKVAELLRAIACKKNGAVVLPGLDQNLSPESFAEIGAADDPMPGHPQFGLKRLIERIGIARAAVEPLGEAANPSREVLLSRAFDPAANGFLVEDGARDTPDGITLIEAADAREEALAIAAVLRETLSKPEQTAVLVTPDRALARRVCAELARWNIAADDSAGLPLGDTEAGRFARLAVEAAAPDAAPAALLALLRHPLAVKTFSRTETDLIEVAALRGLRPAGGIANLAHAIAQRAANDYHYRDARSTLDPAQWAAAGAAAAKLAEACAPLTALGMKAAPFAAVARAHLETLLLLAPALAENRSNDAEALLDTIEEFANVSHHAPEMRIAEYAGAFPALTRDRIVRPDPQEQARIRILGPLEARMISADRVVLGGLCEGVWPPEAHTDAWLNRPMRRALHLDLPERRIGLSAHDFVQAAGAQELFITRARKQNGVETIASRFLQRLAAASPDAAWAAAKTNGDNYLALVRALEDAPGKITIDPPRPAPPVAVRPTRFSVSDVRDLVRDPYTIYAKHILKLYPLEPVDDEPDAAERGTLLHGILSKFAAKYPAALPDNALDELLGIGRDAFAKFGDFPAVHAVWWPRFARAARWFVEEEVMRRETLAHSFSETGGRLPVAVNGKELLLTARADRIDVLRDGAVSVLDYKTGSPPTFRQAIIGLEPQLLLEAAIARQGGFAEAGRAETIAEIGVVKLSGGIPAGEFKLFALTKSLKDEFGAQSLEELADRALARFTALLAQYDDAARPYLSTPRAKWKSRYGDYDHLARIKEWSAWEAPEL